MVVLESRVWIYHQNKWKKGVVCRHATRNKGKHLSNTSVRLPSGTVVCGKVYPQKNNGRVLRRSPPEKIPPRRVGARLPPFRLPSVRVKGIVFEGRGRYGDYEWMLRQPAFFRFLFGYNENLEQQRDKQDNLRGGGNAVARPYRPFGRAIGIPTGSLATGGWSQLDQVVDAHGTTVRQVIDDSVDEIGDHIYKHSGRFHTFLYSTAQPSQTKVVDELVSSHLDATIKNSEDGNSKSSDFGDGLIGTGIFRVGHEVCVYITEKIHALDEYIKSRYRRERSQCFSSAPHPSSPNAAVMNAAVIG
jgi:hypothetical protein